MIATELALSWWRSRVEPSPGRRWLDFGSAQIRFGFDSANIPADTYLRTLHGK